MSKMLAGFAIGIVLTGALFLGPFHPSSTGAEAGTPAVSDNETAIDLSSVDIKQMLTDAGSKISDADTKQYYQILMDNYDIDNLPGAAERQDNMNPLQVLPNMERVNNAAITTPLEEAGKQIRDKDIAGFYQNFLDDVGWNITISSP